VQCTIVQLRSIRATAHKGEEEVSNPDPKSGFQERNQGSCTSVAVTGSTIHSFMLRRIKAPVNLP
jgi:hypothetical protein